MDNRFLQFHKDHAIRLARKMTGINTRLMTGEPRYAAEGIVTDKYADDALATDANMLMEPFAAWFADLNGGGKMLRGVLTNLGYALTLPEESWRAGDGSPVAESDGLALAFELFQTAVLVHDDVIDHAAMRRGRETIHTRYQKALDGDRAQKRRETAQGTTGANGLDPDNAGCSIPEAAAICVGDAGLFAAGKLIADSYAHEPAVADFISYFHQVAIDTIRGELLDVILPSEWQRIEGSEDADLVLANAVRSIYELKTAQYSVAGPLHLGLLYGGAEEALLRAMDDFGLEAGVMFQIKDDILGIFAEEEETGKDGNADIEEGKITILYQFVKRLDPGVAAKLDAVYGVTPVTKENVETVREIFTQTGALSYAEEAMKMCRVRAEATLSKMPLEEDKKAVLRDFLAYLYDRKK